MTNIVNKRFVDEPLRRTGNHTASFRFLNVALLAEKKGVHHLIDAFARAFGDDPGVTLEIVGDGSERPRLEALARDLGVAGRVTFLGVMNRDEVVVAMSRADGFVLPSLFETFGVVVIEALALGKPVVATRCGGPEAILRAEDGLIVPAGDVGALAEAMERLRANHPQYDPEEIRASCVARFGEQAVVGRLSRAYEAIPVSRERV
jgi:glycosyltransferase involved in cell wall biosynthesis